MASGSAHPEILAAEGTATKRRAIPWPDWLILLIGFLAIFNGLPFLAPVFMKLGWEGAAQVIYWIYGGLCHQMAQRSFFLFGPQGFQMYSLEQLPIRLEGLSTAGQLLALKRFIGNEAMGWKVAWSDRMVYMYTTPLFVAVIYAFLRGRVRIKPLPLWGFFVLLLPMLIDGGTHWLSDLAGFGQGFRETNAWLATLTNQAFPPAFYAGDGLGSFNSLMRLLSGVAFGVAVGWLLYPNMDRMFLPPRKK